MGSVYYIFLLVLFSNKTKINLSPVATEETLYREYGTCFEYRMRIQNDFRCRNILAGNCIKR